MMVDKHTSPTTLVNNPAPKSNIGKGVRDELMKDFIKYGIAKIRPNGTVLYFEKLWQKTLDGVWHVA